MRPARIICRNILPDSRRLLGAITLLFSIWCVAAAPMHADAQTKSARPTLTIYFIDVEGGQSTLIVTPAGETMLIDAGFPSDGTFASKPGLAMAARDPQRILEAAHDARIARIDYLMLTHYHADHAGGVVELAQLLPIRTFIDHSAPLPEAEAAVAGTRDIYDAYVSLRVGAQHIEPKPGDRLPLKGVDIVVVSSAGSVLTAPLKGAGRHGASCGASPVPAQEKTENPRSTGVILSFGAFRFLDVGDLTGPPLRSLVCPINLVGRASLYLVAHHGGSDAADIAVFQSINPLVAILNNGPQKGAGAETFAVLRQVPSIDAWQLHRSLNVGVTNMTDESIANLDESTHAWIKLVGLTDGSFTITNGRTGITRAYHR